MQRLVYSIDTQLRTYYNESSKHNFNTIQAFIHKTYQKLKRTERMIEATNLSYDNPVKRHHIM